MHRLRERACERQRRAVPKRQCATAGSTSAATAARLGRRETDDRNAHGRERRTAKRMRGGEGGSIGRSAAVRPPVRPGPAAPAIYPCDVKRRRARLRAFATWRASRRAEGATAVVRPDESGGRPGGRAEVSHRRRGTRRSGTGPRSARSLQPGNPGGLRIPAFRILRWCAGLKRASGSYVPWTALLGPFNKIPKNP